MGRSRFGRQRSAASACVGAAIALAVVCLLEGPAAAGGLSVGQTGNLDPAGQTVSVSGSGFQPSIQLYVALCNPAVPSGGACDFGNFRVADVNGEGSFSTSLRVVAAFGTTDCHQVTCAIQTSKVGDGADRSQESSVPLSFAAAPPPPTAPPPTAPPTAPPSGGTGGGGGGTGGGGTGGGGAPAGTSGTPNAVPGATTPTEETTETTVAPTTPAPTTTTRPTTTTSERRGETRDTELASSASSDDDSGGGGAWWVVVVAIAVVAAGAAGGLLYRRRRAA